MQTKALISAIALIIFFLTAAAPAHACQVMKRLDPQHITYASIVVVGRISDYEIVPDQPAKPGFGRFKIQVDEVLVGRPVRTLIANWFNSTFAFPDKLAEGPFLIGLHELNYPEPKSLVVLQAACTPPLILETASAEAKAVRKILSERPQ